jgi:hypothetical protein
VNVGIFNETVKLLAGLPQNMWSFASAQNTREISRLSLFRRKGLDNPPFEITNVRNVQRENDLLMNRLLKNFLGVVAKREIATDPALKSLPEVRWQ